MKPPMNDAHTKGTLRRRVFLAGAAFAAVVLPYVGIKLKWGRPEEIVVAVLKRRVGHLQVDEASFDTFAASYVPSKPGFQNQLRKLSTISGPYAYVTAYPVMPMGHPVRRLEDNIVSNYLLSTDFFEHGADEARPVQYVAFYDPITTPCRNYLAKRATA